MDWASFFVRVKPDDGDGGAGSAPADGGGEGTAGGEDGGDARSPAAAEAGEDGAAGAVSDAAADEDGFEAKSGWPPHRDRGNDATATAGFRADGTPR